MGVIQNFTTHILGEIEMNVKGIKEKRYGKRTLCLRCYEAEAGKVNARAVSEPKGMSGIQQLQSGRCDECRRNF